MAQEKQQPPLSKAARKGAKGQKNNNSSLGASDEAKRVGGGNSPYSKSPPGGLSQNTGKTAGQPGGPNVKPTVSSKVSQGGSMGSGASGNSMKTIGGRQISDQDPYPTRVSSAPRRDESTSTQNSDDQGDRRRAAPARRRFAANDDVPSIGGLIFALQQRPSNRPFVIAGIASAVWVGLSAGLVWSVFWPAFSQVTSVAQFFQSVNAMGTLAVITIPIALFWFLALLIWRAQELRLMSSAMTEVAVRLAEPDKAAEQSVASLGQSVRRQVTAMNDAISRALGRAGELEAMVHNEVAALERSYSENEHRIRNLIGELAHERTALTNDSERISSALSGLGQRVTKQIEHQGLQTTQLLEKTSGSVSSKLIESSEKVAQSMSEQSNSVVSTMTAMNDRVGREMPALLDRMGKEQIKLGRVVEHASKNLTALDSSIGHHAGALNNALTDRTQQLEGIFRKHVQTMSISMDERSQSLDNTLGNKLQTFDNTLHSRMDDFEDTLTNTTQKIDRALSDKAQYLDMAISSRVTELDSALIQRSQVIDAAFTERLQALDHALHTSSKTLDQAFAHRAEELGRSMDSRSQYIVQTIGAKTKELDNALMSGAKTLQLTTEDVGNQVIKTIHGLAQQAQYLKDISSSMQTHVSQITSNLRDQGNFVVETAAKLEHSHDRIGNKLGNSQSHLQKLVESISHRTSDLDMVMGSYSKQLEQTLAMAEKKATDITQSLHSRSATQSMAALSELTKLRDTATNQTEKAIHDMKDRIAAVSNEMSSQINTLSSEISDTQSHLKEQLQQIPDTTRKSASLMRRTLQDQLKALESLSSISSGSDHIDVSTPGSLHGGAGGYQPSANKGALNSGPLNSGPVTDAFQAQGILPKPMNSGQFGAGYQGAQNNPQSGSSSSAFNQQHNLNAHNPGAMQNERDAEIDAITETLAKRVSDQMDLSELSKSLGQTNSPLAGGQLPHQGVKPLGGGNELGAQGLAGQRAGGQMPAGQPLGGQALGGQSLGQGAPGRGGSSHWSMGDLLARASEDDHADQPEDTGSVTSALGDISGQQASAPPININAIAQLVDQAAAVELWRTYRSGLKTPISESVYNDRGEAFRRINGLYGSDVAFRGNVDRYIADFDRLLNDAEAKDPAGNLSTKHLTSDSGRVYLLLMHAAGRIGG